MKLSWRQAGWSYRVYECPSLPGQRSHSSGFVQDEGGDDKRRVGRPWRGSTVDGVGIGWTAVAGIAPPSNKVRSNSPDRAQLLSHPTVLVGIGSGSLSQCFSHRYETVNTLL